MPQIEQEQPKWQMEQIPEIQELWSAAQQGNAEAQFNLGKVLQFGKEIWFF